MKSFFLILTVIITLLFIATLGLWKLNLIDRENKGLPLSPVSIDQIISPTVSTHNRTATIPTIDTIFSKDHSHINRFPQDKLRTIIATGDIIPARSVNVIVLRRNNAFWPYEKVKTGIDAFNGDIIFGNLETPLIQNCPPTNQGMIFCGSNKNIEGLNYIGMDIVSLANNHAGNYGEAGVIETIASLKKNNIDVTGINGPFYKEIRGMTFAFLGYNDISKDQPGVADAENERIKKEISEAKQKAQVVIVTFHWGEEYRSQPDNRQIELGHFTIDAGADLVIGNHPHWIQPIEIYKGKLITYAHGNFVFDQMWSEETKQGVIGKYTFYENQLVDAEYFPIYIQDYGQPSFLEGPAKDKILENMYTESKKRAGL